MNIHLFGASSALGEAFLAENEKNRTINLDIGNLCTLECPKCARQGRFKYTRPYAIVYCNIL